VSVKKEAILKRINYAEIKVKLKKRYQTILLWIKKDSLGFFNKHITNVLFSCLLIILFLFIENSLTNKAAELFEKNTDIKEKGLFICLILITFLIACYLLRRKRKLLAIDTVLIFIYVKYRYFPSSAYQIDGVDIDLWTIFNKPFHFYYIDLILVFYIFMIGSMIYYRKRKMKYEMGFLYPDLPLKEWAEFKGTSLIAEDKYARERFANEIVESIEIMKPFKAFSIGISGQWGSGKSSLFDLIKEKIKQKENNLKVLEFSPWYTSKPETLISDFFRVLENTFQGDIILLENLKSYATGIASIEQSIFNTGVLKDIFNHHEDLKEKYKKIAEILKRQKKLFVIMIDDLDRLDKKEIIGVLKLIRIIADFPNIIYLAAYDRKHLDAAIKRGLTKHMPDKYIDKIFNMEFKIPEPSPDRVLNQLKTHLFYSLENIKVDVNEAELSLYLKKTKTEHYIENQRDVKRFTNNFIMSYKPIMGDGIDLQSFLLLQLLNYKYPDVYKKIYDNEHVIIPHIQKEGKGKNGAKKKVDVALILGEAGENGKIINCIFNSKSEYRISSQFYFHKYFSLSLFDEIKYQDVEKALGLGLDALKIKIGEYYIINDQLLIEILSDIFEIKSSVDYTALKNYLSALYLIYSKKIELLGAPTIEDEEKELYTSELNKIAETVWNVISNAELDNKKYDTFREVFESEKIDISIVTNLLKAKDGENFKDIIV